MPPKKTSSPRRVKVKVRAVPPEPETDEVLEAVPPAPPSMNLYRRIAVSFVVLVAITLLIVLYVSTVQATIRVKPVSETVKTEFLLDAVKIPTQPTEVRGRVTVGTLGRLKDFEPIADGAKQVEGTARGKVVLKNVSGASQALIANTRLLSKDGVLFRMDAAATVPAKGSVTVNVHADKPGETGDIEPTTFTIPGLNESRQKEITGESTEAFSGGVRTVKVITEADLTDAAEKLKAELAADAEAMLREGVSNLYSGGAFRTEILEQEWSVEPGSEADTFSISMTVKVTGVFFDRKTVEELAMTRLYQQLGAGRQFSTVNTKSLQVTVDKVDLENEKASMRVYLDGRAVPSSASKALDPGRFAGKSPEEVKSMLTLEGVAVDVQVDLSPFWVRKVPRLRDHIYVEIE